MIKESTVATVEPEPKKPQATAGMKDVIRNPNFVKLWSAQILSQTAQQIVNFALVLHIQAITGSSTAVSGIIIAFTIPAVLFAAIAGVFVERNSKKLMLTLTNILRGVLVLAYIFTDPAWGVGAVLPIFYIITLLFSAVSQFFNPAEAAMIPLVVRKDQLIAANSLFNLTLPATQLGGFVVLGPLLLNTVFHDNYNGLYILIFILCLGAAFMTWLLPQDRPESTAAERRKKGEKVSVGGVAGGAAEIARSGYREAGEELAEGWRFIRRDPVIMSSIIYWSVSIAVFMMLGVIGPGFLSVLGMDQSKLFYVLLPGGLGLVVGVLLVGRIARRDNRESMINFSLLAAGVTLILFAAIYPILSWLYSTIAGTKPNELVVLLFLGALTFLLGLFNSFISVPAQTALQERSPEAIRARVFSAFFTISNAILLVPVFFAGALADALGQTAAVFLIGVAVLITAGVGLYRSRDRRAAERLAEPQDGHVHAEEAEAALTAASPAPRPIMAKEHQDTMDREHLERSTPST
jgi:MFS family permease